MPGLISDRFHSSPVFRLSGLSMAGVFLGGAIYFLFRSKALAVFPVWTPSVDNASFGAVREFALEYAFRLPPWVVYSLPGGLWAFAFALLVTGIWAGSPSPTKYAWLAFVPLAVAGSEILQWAGLLPGTFCRQDLLLGMAGMAAGFVTGKSLTKPPPARNLPPGNLPAGPLPGGHPPHRASAAPNPPHRASTLPKQTPPPKRRPATGLAELHAK